MSVGSFGTSRLAQPTTWMIFFANVGDLTRKHDDLSALLEELKRLEPETGKRDKLWTFGNKQWGCREGMKTCLSEDIPSEVWTIWAHLVKETLNELFSMVANRMLFCAYQQNTTDILPKSCIHMLVKFCQENIVDVTKQDEKYTMSPASGFVGKQKRGCRLKILVGQHRKNHKKSLASAEHFNWFVLAPRQSRKIKVSPPVGHYYGTLCVVGYWVVWILAGNGAVGTRWKGENMKTMQLCGMYRHVYEALDIHIA